MLPSLLVSPQVTRFGLALVTFLVVSVIWVFFRAPDFTKATLLLGMFGVIPVEITILKTLALLKVGIITAGLLGFQWYMREKSVVQVAGRLPVWGLGLVWTCMLIVLVLTQKSSNSFIYFQF